MPTHEMPDMPSEDEIGAGVGEMIDRANLRFPGLQRLLETATTDLYMLLGSYDPDEGEVEGPERLQEYHGFNDEMMSYLFHQDAPETTLEDVMDSESQAEVGVRVDDMYLQEARLLKVMGDLFHYAAAMEMPLPEESDLDF